MLVPLPDSYRRRAITRVREERGTTLIELLVALVAGLIVTGALLGILVISLRQSTTLGDKLQADQIGRIAMTKVADELHSACISPSFTPVQTGSGENELMFITAYSPEAVIPNAEEHRIVYTSANKTLTDYSYKSSGGSWPKFTFPAVSSPTSTVKLAGHISPVVTKGTTERIFTYYKYAEKSSESTETPLTTLEEKKGLTESQAASAASVLIQFAATAEDGNTALERSINLRDQITFSFSVPNSETPVHDAPCQ